MLFGICFRISQRSRWGCGEHKTGLWVNGGSSFCSVYSVLNSPNSLLSEKKLDKKKTGKILIAVEAG